MSIVPMYLHTWDMHFDNLYLVSNYLPKGWLANIVNKKLRTQIQDGRIRIRTTPKTRWVLNYNQNIVHGF